MSTSFDDKHLHTIVEEVVRRTLGQSVPTVTPENGLVAIGADHRGQALKADLMAWLKELNYPSQDVDSSLPEGAEYPDIAEAVALRVASGGAWRGILIDGAGIGSCMAANKVPGVRAALCYNQASAANSREHNDANVLTLGSGMIGPSLARLVTKTWLETPFGGGRHAKRVDKIMDLERRYRGR
jgi:ribose 5-phosphate isomerase B